jgi:hypothetical protein
MSIRHVTEPDLVAVVQRTIVTLSAGEATWTFATPFSAKPVISHMFEEAADGQPITIKVKSFTQSGGLYTAVTVKGYRAQTLPSGLLVLSTLNLFNIFGGASPAVLVHLYASTATQ